MTEPEITSAKNPHVRAAAALRDRRDRDAAGLTLLDGARELARALAGGASVVEVFVDEDRLGYPGADAVEEARRRGAAIVTVSGPVLDRLAYGDRAEGLVAIVRIPDTALAAPRSASRCARRRCWRASRSRATSAPCSGRPMPPGRTR